MTQTKTPPADSAPTATTAKDKAETPGSFLRFLLILVLAAWAFRSFVVAPFSIPSGSMLPTLYIGDYLVVTKWPYGYSKYSFPLGIPSFSGRILEHDPKRGDVAVFRHPDGSADLIKRVIGVPGDRIAVRGGQVILNGKPLQRVEINPVGIAVSANSPCRPGMPTKVTAVMLNGRLTCVYPAWRETLPGGPSYTTLDQMDGGVADDFDETVVPAGHVFMMGDNRDNSLDSRFALAEGGVGMVPIENLIGRAAMTFWSTDGSSSYINPFSWFGALRGDRLGNGYVDGRE